MNTTVRRQNSILIFALVLLLVLVSSTLAETLIIDCTSNTPVLSATLEAGQLYEIIASGTYKAGSSGGNDAEWKWIDPASPYEEPCDPVHDVIVDGVEYDWLGTTDGIVFTPNTFSPDHVYKIYYIGKGQPASFYVEDYNSYHDNSGSLTVVINPLAVTKELVDQLVIDATQKTMVSTPVLLTGQLYELTASGTYKAGSSGGNDAEWKWINPASPYEEACDPVHDIIVDGIEYDWLGTTDGVIYAPHVFSASHEYKIYVVGGGEAIEMYIEDYSSYHDNSGSLSVTINKLNKSSLELQWILVDETTANGDSDFIGYVSKYETTNAQYCQFLNDALSSGDITIGTDHLVYGADGMNSGKDFIGAVYCKTYSADSNSSIDYIDGDFQVRDRNNINMTNYPVIMITWEGAVAFCNYYGYRLPTSSEWEEIADYNGTFNYGCGVSINQDIANYNFANPMGWSEKPYVNPVGYYGEFGYGLCDLTGNVWEWTSTLSIQNSHISSWWQLGSISRKVARSHMSMSIIKSIVLVSLTYKIGFRCILPRTLHIDTIHGDDSNNGASRETAFATIIPRD